MTTEFTKLDDFRISAMRAWDFWNRESLVLEPGESSIADCSPERREDIRRQLIAWRERLITTKALGAC